MKFLVMGPVAFLAALVLFAFTSAIFTASMPDGLKYLFITALSWLAWRLMRPHTALGRMHLPGKKLAGQVMAMKLGGPATGGKRSGSGEEDEDVTGNVASRTAAAGRDQLVYTRTGRPIGPPRHTDEDKPVMYYPVASATAGGTGQPLGMLQAEPASPSHRTPAIAPGSVTPRTQPAHSGEPDAYQQTAEPAQGRPDERRRQVGEQQPSLAARPAAAVSVITAGQSPPRPAALPASAPHPRTALPPSEGPLEGRLFPPGQQLPGKVHESNVTYDKDGNAVFQVYRPAGSRSYAQAQ